jgi:hypothetical protein
MIVNRRRVETIIIGIGGGGFEILNPQSAITNE